MGKGFTITVLFLLAVSMGLIITSCLLPKDYLWPVLLAGVGTMLTTVFGAMLAVFVIGGVGKVRRRTRELLRKGRAADAVVVAAERVGDVLREGLDFPKYHADVIVDVQPDTGRPFRARVDLYIYEHEWPRLTPGLPIRVKYDPDHPSRVALPGFGGIGVDGTDELRPTDDTPDMDALARLPPSSGFGSPRRR